VPLGPNQVSTRAPHAGSSRSSDRAKRCLDIAVSGIGLAISSPVIIMAAIAIWLQDRSNPFYISERVGLAGETFRIFKLRTMIPDADRAGIDTSIVGDTRVTRIGAILRASKIDELPQLWNVLRGEMSLVGPRPNVRRETDLYTGEEMELLSIRPGITDLSSIVFSDQSERLAGVCSPHIGYNQLIRPWKSRLGLLYTRNRTIWLDLHILLLTSAATICRKRALQHVARLVGDLEGGPVLSAIAAGTRPIFPHPPPGATEVVRGNKTEG
jgi:lipopolysaccharide/colanic/teichoic acid biosynthesis glycosyltransferase